MTLTRRLQRAGRWDAEYAGNLSSHLPMALHALHRLGASAQRQDQFSAHYTRRLHAAPAMQPWPRGVDWRVRLGDPQAWPGYRTLFRQWRLQRGAAGLLRHLLPGLLAGCGGAAFHGLIRTAHAFEAQAAAEQADSLAYWACRWMGLGAVPDRADCAAVSCKPVRNPARLLPALMALPDSGAGLIAQRMHAAAAEPLFDLHVANLRIDEATLPRLARLSAQLYARSGNFTVLHLVTSAHAMRVLLPYSGDARQRQLALASYWRAYAAGVVAAKATLGRPAPLLGWPDLLATAQASDDDHLIKLVDACRQEEAAHGGAPDWRRAASRAVFQARGSAAQASCDRMTAL